MKTASDKDKMKKKTGSLGKSFSVEERKMRKGKISGRLKMKNRHHRNARTRVRGGGGGGKIFHQKGLNMRDFI